MKDFRPFLKHVLDEIEFIERALKGKSFEDFMKDEILKRAIVRSLEVIGEAVKNVQKTSERSTGIYRGGALRG